MQERGLRSGSDRPFDSPQRQANPNPGDKNGFSSPRTFHPPAYIYAPAGGRLFGEIRGGSPSLAYRRSSGADPLIDRTHEPLTKGPGRTFGNASQKSASGRSPLISHKPVSGQLPDSRPLDN